MDVPGVLKSIGLTDSETKVYLALLDIGDTTRGELVNRSGIAGSKVYEVLDKLHSKGLISIYIVGGIKHFKAVSPKQVLQYIDDQKAEMGKSEEMARKVLPELMARFASSEEEQEVGLLVGMKGLEIIFNEQIELLRRGRCVMSSEARAGLMKRQSMLFSIRSISLGRRKALSQRCYTTWTRGT